MHYRNGREAKNGDLVVQLDYDSGQVLAFGKLRDAKPEYGAFCNGFITPTQHPDATACLCDCLHVDDLAAVLARHGLDRRPGSPKPPVSGLKVFDLDDGSWTWDGLAASLTSRFGVEDRSELVMALLTGDPDLLADVASWRLVKDAVAAGVPA